MHWVSSMSKSAKLDTESKPVERRPEQHFHLTLIQMNFHFNSFRATTSTTQDLIKGQIIIRKTTLLLGNHSSMEDNHFYD